MKSGLKDPYLTKDSWVKKWFAQRSADEDGSRPVLLKVRVEDTSKLRPDIEMYEEPLSSIIRRYTDRDLAQVTAEDWNNMITQGVVPYPKNDRDWETSLKAVRSVWYSGRITPEDILDVELR